MDNPNVTRIVQIDPDTGRATELFHRTTSADGPAPNGQMEPTARHDGLTSETDSRTLRDTDQDSIDRASNKPDADVRAEPSHSWRDDTDQQRGDDRGYSDDDGPRENAVGPDGRYKISGHGDYHSGDGTFTVPADTSVTVYGEHGSPITQSLGNLIESGGDTSRVFKKTYYPGETMPNYTLLPPDDMNIVGTPHTVDRATTLSDLLQPNMGAVDFVACLGSWNHRVFDVHGIYHQDTYDFIEKYPWPEPENLGDDDW